MLGNMAGGCRGPAQCAGEVAPIQDAVFTSNYYERWWEYSHMSRDNPEWGPRLSDFIKLGIIVSFRGKSLILKCSLKIDKNKYTVINKKH